MAPDQPPQASGLTVPHPRVTGGIVHGISRTGPGTAGASSAASRRSPAKAVRPAPAPAAGRPGAAAVRGGRLGLGLLLPQITVAPTAASSRATETLIGVGFGVLGLVSIIFSLLFLVVQWAFSSLSPRLNLFRDDPIVWRTFGLAVGVFVFSVTAALVIGNDPVGVDYSSVLVRQHAGTRGGCRRGDRVCVRGDGWRQSARGSVGAARAAAGRSRFPGEAGGNCCDTRSHVVSELVEEVWLMPET